MKGWGIRRPCECGHRGGDVILLVVRGVVVLSIVEYEEGGPILPFNFFRFDLFLAMES